MGSQVMGVLNVTPDSFSDGGRYLDPDLAIARGMEMVAAGAAVIDVGGESSRPGAEPVPAGVERERVLPVVRALAPLTRVSIDTTKPDVAEAAVAAGATLLNDISASLWPVAARLGVGWVAMHMQGTPATMQVSPSYRDVVAEVRGFLRARADAALSAGVSEVWIDPGIGFGKTAEHNLQLLAGLGDLVRTGLPVVVGVSRKRFISATLGEADPGDRIEGSVASATWAMLQGARMVRVHDVAETVRAAALVGDAPAPAESGRCS